MRRELERVFGLSLFAAMVLSNASRARADAIDDYVRSELARRKIPGLALAVVKDGKVEKLAGYGIANLELDVPVTPKTVFQIQSVTKTFTSAAILMLVEEGKLSLDDPVSKHLPGTPDSWKPITLRHLLSHTSGIKDFINDPTASLRIDVTETEVLKATAPRPLNFTPGEKYAYSNTNYHLLAMIIRQITGKAYGQFLAERIFTPLGMSATRIVSLSEIIPNRAAGYLLAGDSLRNGDFIAESILGYGGGGIISTAEDLAKWAIALDAGKVLKKSTLETAWTGMELNNKTRSAYGLGWQVGTTNTHPFVAHGGSHRTGFTSYFLHFREDHLTVIVLTNARHGNPGRIAQQVAGIFLPAIKPPALKVIEDREPKVAGIADSVIKQLTEGKINEAMFTPTMAKVLEAQSKSLKDQITSGGEFRSIQRVVRGSEPESRPYRYRVTFTRRTWILSLDLTKDSKVSGLWVEEE